MPRLFSAIEIPQSIAARLTLLRAGLTGARWIDPENYHLTLRFIGDVDGATAHDFTLALSEIAAAPFELKLNGLGSFGGNKPRAIFAGFAPSEGLAALRRANERAAREAGLPPEGRNFQPHVTLARLRGARADSVAAYLERQGRIEAEPLPAQADMTDAPKLSLAQRATGFVTDHWRWILPLALLPLLGWLWAWHAHRSVYDEAGLPRGPKL